MSIDQLRPLVRRLATRASERAYNWMLNGARTSADLLDAMPILASPYAQSVAILSSDWYQGQDEDSRFSAQMYDDLDPRKLANIADWVFSGPQLPESRARVAAHRLVFDAARRTVFVNAAEEGVAIARHESATECTRCRQAATTSVRHRGLGSGDVDQDFHPMCEGLFVPVRKDVWTPPDYALKWAT